MKAKIFVFLVAALFIGTTFAGASAITKTNEPNAIPCPATTMIPGLWNTGYKDGGKFSIVYGMYKHVEAGKEVIYKTEMSFVQFGSGAVFTMIDGQMVKIPSSAERIELTIKERKDGGSWAIIKQETIIIDMSDENGFYTHYYPRTYDSDGKYEVEVSAKVYGNTILHGEISWDSGGGRLYTMTTAVGTTKAKMMPLKNLLGNQIVNLFSNILSYIKTPSGSTFAEDSILTISDLPDAEPKVSTPNYPGIEDFYSDPVTGLLSPRANIGEEITYYIRLRFSGKGKIENILLDVTYTYKGKSESIDVFQQPITSDDVNQYGTKTICFKKSWDANGTYIVNAKMSSFDWVDKPVVWGLKTGYGLATFVGPIGSGSKSVTPSFSNFIARHFHNYPDRFPMPKALLEPQ